MMNFRNFKDNGTWKDFCKSTSLHGYNYLTNSSSNALKFFWSSVIVSITIIGMVFKISNTIEYLSAGFVTSIDSSTAPLTVSLSE